MPPLIPPGTYRAYCVDAQLGYTSTGKEQVALRLVLDDEQRPEHNGRQITYYGYFTEATMKHSVKGLRALGWQGDDLAELSTCIAGTGGQYAEVVIEIEADQEGVEHNRARWINPPGQGLQLKQPMDDAQKRAFSARMKASVVSVTKSDPTIRPQANAQVAQPAAAPAQTAQGDGTPMPGQEGCPF